jgi:hypothetical protein
MSTMDRIFHRAAYLKKSPPRGRTKIGDSDQFGLDVIWEYESIEHPPSGAKWYDWAIGIGWIIASWPFNAALVFSFYCVFLLLLTFLSAFIVAYLLNPLYAFLEDDPLLTAVAIIELFTAAPLLAFILYVLCQVVMNVIAGVQAVVVNAISSLPDSGPEVMKLRRKDGLKMYLLKGGALLVVGVGFFYLTIFVEGCSIILGCIVLLLVPFGILLNFAAPCLGTFLTLFRNVCGVPGLDITNLIYRWLRHKATGEWSSSDIPEDTKGNKFTVDVETYKERTEQQETFQSLSVALKIALAFDYFWIGNFADHVIRSELSQPCKRTTSTVLVWVCVALNIFVIVVDFREYRRYDVGSFLASIVIRIVLLPVLSFFHPVIAWLHTIKGGLLRWVLRLSSITAIVVMVAVGIIASAVGPTLDDVRLKSLDVLPVNYTRAPAFKTDLALCNAQFSGRSLLELMGLSFGAYDISDEAVFAQQLEYFFGPKWNATIGYTIRTAAAKVPYVVYSIGRTTVFGLRGFSSPQELALQAQAVVRYYVLPLLLDTTPLYDTFKDGWLGSYTKHAYFFGLHWFSPMSQFGRVVDAVLAEYHALGLNETNDVVFVGSNIGGVVAKVLGMITRQRGIGFISLPSVDEELMYEYDFDDLARSRTANVYVTGGWFGVEDPEIGTNFAMPGEGTAIGGVADSIYGSFCLMAEVCGHHAQLDAYCKTALGEEAFESIVEFASANNTTETT